MLLVTGFSLTSLAGLAGCQSNLGAEHQMSIHERDVLGGWSSSDSPLRLDGYDKCQKSWRALVESPALRSTRRGMLRTWELELDPSQWPQLGCLLDVEDEGHEGLARLRISQDNRSLLTMNQESQQCFLDEISAGESVFSRAADEHPADLSTLLERCGGRSEIRLRLSDVCEAGSSLQRIRVPLKTAGNLQRVKFPEDEQSRFLMYHYPNSMLVGKASSGPTMQREFRGYLAFEPPEGIKRVLSGRLRLFSNFDTVACGHRDDFGCGYASQDASETLSLSLVESWRCAMASDDSQCGIKFGLARDPSVANGLFEAIEKNEVGRIEMSADDVDTWLEIPLAQELMRSLSADDGAWWLFGTRVLTIDPSSPERQEWLFVDHLLGKSITSNLAPELDLLVCQA